MSWEEDVDRESQRVEDLEMLRELAKAPRREHGDSRESGITDSEREAFEDMHRQITDGGYRCLTRKQRVWVETMHKTLLLSDPAKRNENVPRGREVVMAPVLQNLPKRPPMRASFDEHELARKERLQAEKVIQERVRAAQGAERGELHQREKPMEWDGRQWKEKA